MGDATVKVQAAMVDPSTFTRSGIGSEHPVIVSADTTSGALLTLNRAATPAIDGVEAYAPEPTADTYVGPVTSTSTAYVASDAIDTAGYRFIVVFPNKTTGSVAGDAAYRIQWSLDNSNWFEGIIMIPTTGVMVICPDVTITTATAAGYKAASVITQSTLARYARISQQSKTAATHTVEYHYQLL